MLSSCAHKKIKKEEKGNSYTAAFFYSRNDFCDSIKAMK